MKWAFGGVGLLLFGLLTFMGIYMVLEGTIINEEEYHGLKEAMEGAMYDSVDIDYYHKTGEIKIIKEKFVEDFTRRFTETNVYKSKGFKLEFYDIIESPPKVSVRIYGHSNEYDLSLDNSKGMRYDIVNQLDAILEYSSKHLFTYEYYNFGIISAINEYDKETGITSNGKLNGVKINNLRIPQELQEIYNINESNLSKICSVKKIEYAGVVEDFTSAKKIFDENKNLWYKKPPSITGTFCEINTVSLFKYKAGVGVEDVKVTSSNSNCLSGYKYRVIWECSR